MGFGVPPDTGSAATERSPFLGEWEAIDVIDGSHMRMKITGGAEPHHVKLFDDWASVCPEGGPATAMAKPWLGGPWAVADFGTDLKVRCHTGHYRAERKLLFWYYPMSDTLMDDFGNTWFRAN